MSRLPVFFVMLFALFAFASAPVRADSLTWPLTANPLPNAPVGNLVGLPEAIGPGPAPQMVLYTPYSGGQRLWVGTTGWIMGPLDTTRYLQFDAAAAPGYNFTVTDVSFNYGDNPLTMDFNTLNSEVYYSVDNWSTSTPLTTSPLAYYNTSVSVFSRSGLNVPVPSGQKFSLRIYPYAIKDSVAMTPTFAIHSNVVIAGRTRPGGGGGKLGKLCVFKFHDTNGNAKQEPGESPLSGWVFEVRDASGAVVATLTTDGKGAMCTELPAGTYTVVEQPQAGYTATTPMSQTVTVTAGKQARVRFGNRKGGGGGDKGGKLCVYKFYDENRNGKQDAGEQPMEGFVFEVRDASGHVVATLTTNAQGTMCTALPAGNYTVVELPQAGYTATTPTNQGATVTSGKETKVTFGNRKGGGGGGGEGGKLCVYKFYDENRNGKQDAGEQPMEGFVFEVRDASGHVVATLTTNAQGTMCTALPAGNYTVVELPQAGYTATTPTNQGATVNSGQETKVTFGNRKGR